MSTPHLTPAPSPLRTYSAALVSMGLVLLAAFTSVSHWDRASLWQLILVGVSAAGTYFIPLIPGKWSAWGKTGFAALSAVASAFTPLFVHETYSPQTVAMVVFAGLQVIGTHLGVSIRQNS